MRRSVSTQGCRERRAFDRYCIRLKRQTLERMLCKHASVEDRRTHEHRSRVVHQLQ